MRFTGGARRRRREGCPRAGPMGVRIFCRRPEDPPRLSEKHPKYFRDYQARPVAASSLVSGGRPGV